MAEFVTLNWRARAEPAGRLPDPRGFRAVKFRGLFYDLIYRIPVDGGAGGPRTAAIFDDLRRNVLTTAGVINTNVDLDGRSCCLEFVTAWPAGWLWCSVYGHGGDESSLIIDGGGREFSCHWFFHRTLAVSG